MLGNPESAAESSADQRMLGGIFKYRYRATHPAQTNQNSALQTSPVQPSIKSSPTNFTNNSSSGHPIQDVCSCKDCVSETNSTAKVRPAVAHGDFSSSSTTSETLSSHTSRAARQSSPSPPPLSTAESRSSTLRQQSSESSTLSLQEQQVAAMQQMQAAFSQMQQMQQIQAAAASGGLVTVQVLQPTPVINPLTGQTTITLVPTLALAPAGSLNPAASLNAGLAPTAAAQLAVAAAAAAQANLVSNLNALQRAGDVQTPVEHNSNASAVQNSFVSLSSRAPAGKLHCSCDAQFQHRHQHQPPSFSFSPVSESANDCDGGCEQCECHNEVNSSSRERFPHAEASVVGRLYHRSSQAGTARDSPPHPRHAPTPGISAQFAEQLDLSQMGSGSGGGGGCGESESFALSHMQNVQMDEVTAPQQMQTAHTCAHTHMNSMASSASGCEAEPSPHGSHGAYLKRRSNKPVLRTRSDVSGTRHTRTLVERRATLMVAQRERDAHVTPNVNVHRRQLQSPSELSSDADASSLSSSIASFFQPDSQPISEHPSRNSSSQNLSSSGAGCRRTPSNASVSATLKRRTPSTCNEESGAALGGEADADAERSSGVSSLLNNSSGSGCGLSELDVVGPPGPGRGSRSVSRHNSNADAAIAAELGLSARKRTVLSGAEDTGDAVDEHFRRSLYGFKAGSQASRSHSRTSSPSPGQSALVTQQMPFAPPPPYIPPLHPILTSSSLSSPVAGARPLTDSLSSRVTARAALCATHSTPQVSPSQFSLLSSSSPSNATSASMASASGPHESASARSSFNEQLPAGAIKSAGDLVEDHFARSLAIARMKSTQVTECKSRFSLDSGTGCSFGGSRDQQPPRSLVSKSFSITQPLAARPMPRSRSREDSAEVLSSCGSYNAALADSATNDADAEMEADRSSSVSTGSGPSPSRSSAPRDTDALSANRMSDKSAAMRSAKSSASNAAHFESSYAPASLGPPPSYSQAVAAAFSSSEARELREAALCRSEPASGPQAASVDEHFERSLAIARIRAISTPNPVPSVHQPTAYEESTNL